MWNATWPLPLMALLVAASVSLIARRRADGGSWFAAFVVLASLSTLGAVTGALAGFARAPTLPFVLPVLCLVGAIALVLISRAGEDMKILVSLCVFCLALTFWIGVNWGVALGTLSTDYEKSEAYFKARADIERAVRTYREKLGLPADFLRPNPE